MIWERLDTLVFHRHISSEWILYRNYQGECSGELFDLLPAAEFSSCTVHHKLKYHLHNLDKWHSTTVRFHSIFLPRDTQLYVNSLPSEIFPVRYNIDTFKKHFYLHLQGWQRKCSSSSNSGVARDRGWR